VVSSREIRGNGKRGRPGTKHGGQGLGGVEKLLGRDSIVSSHGHIVKGALHGLQVGVGCPRGHLCDGGHGGAVWFVWDVVLGGVVAAVDEGAARG
jgi:hypothetical protein